MRRRQDRTPDAQDTLPGDRPGETGPPENTSSETDQADLAPQVARAKKRYQQVFFPKTFDDFEEAFHAAGLSPGSCTRLIKSAREPSDLEPLYRLLSDEGRIPVVDTMRRSQWSWILYGGQGDAKYEIRRKPGKLEITQGTVHKLIKAATVVRNACKDLLDYVWSLPDIPEAIAAADLGQAIDRFEKLHAALQPPQWKKRAGRKSPLGKRERIFEAQVRRLLGKMSLDLKKDDKFVNQLVAEVQALPLDWREVFPAKPTKTHRKR